MAHSNNTWHFFRTFFFDLKCFVFKCCERYVFSIESPQAHTFLDVKDFSHCFCIHQASSSSSSTTLKLILWIFNFQIWNILQYRSIDRGRNRHTVAWKMPRGKVKNEENLYFFGSSLNYIIEQGSILPTFYSQLLRM